MYIPTRIAAAAALCLIALSAESRTLHWRELEVFAKLEASGELAIIERHTMVFDGDWSGGEREFEVRPGQELVFKSMRRVAPDGRETPLSESSTPSRVDQYAWAERNLLRWRVRAPSDPPLRNRELAYVIEYALRNVVARDRETYRLDHDFAFERPGPVERFRLKLELDPAWKVIPETTPLTFERTSLPAGETVKGNFVLAYSGGVPQYLASAPQAPRAEPVKTPPAEVSKPLTLAGFLMNAVAFATFVFFAWLLVERFGNRERELGRFEQIEPTRLWLQNEILTQRPEVVGAAWDHTTGEAEVAALIALMTIERKIEQTREGGQPVLKLLVPRESLSEYERQFVDRLFVAGDSIDKATLRRHYKATGFDPAASLRTPLAREAQRLVGGAPLGAACGLFVAGAALFLFALPAIAVVADDALSTFNSMFGVVALAISLIGSSIYRSAQRPGRGLAWIVVPPALFALLSLLATSPSIAAVFCLSALGIVWSALFVAKARGTPEQIRNQRNLAAARRFFQQHLAARESIEEIWVPYILAFGLSSEFDQWSVAAARGSSPASLRVPSSPRSSAGNVSAPGQASPAFVSGGGAFGGAGATGSWAKDISSFASRVASPSSGSGGSSSGFSSGSSRSSGSSGGGSRSGGGRGGGW